MMKINIAYIGISNTFLFPSCYYKIKNSHTIVSKSEDSIINTLKDGEYIFLDIEKNKEYLESKGIFCKIVKAESSLYLYVMGKAKLIKKYSNDSVLYEIEILSLIKESSIFENMAKETNISLLYKNWFYNEPAKIIQNSLRLKKSNPLIFDVIEFLDSMLHTKNINIRMSLFNIYNYTFYLDIVNYYLNLIVGFQIDTKEISAEQLLIYFKETEELLKNGKLTRQEVTGIKKQYYLVDEKEIFNIKSFNLEVKLTLPKLENIPLNINKKYYQSEFEKKIIECLCLPEKKEYINSDIENKIRNSISSYIDQVKTIR